MAADSGTPITNFICSGTQETNGEGRESSASPWSSSLCSFQITPKISTACGLILYTYLFNKERRCLPPKLHFEKMSLPSCVHGEGSKLRDSALEWVGVFQCLGGGVGGGGSVPLCGDEGG